MARCRCGTSRTVAPGPGLRSVALILVSAPPSGICPAIEAAQWPSPTARRQAPAAHGDPAQLTAHSKAVNPMRRHEDKSGTYNWHIGAQTHALPGPAGRLAPPATGLAA
jgi:hypothetical protein